MGNAQEKYGGAEEDLKRRISLSVCFGKLRERLSERGEGRKRLQMSQERKQGNIKGDIPTISEEEETERIESAISRKGGPDLADLELAQCEQSGTKEGREEEKQSEVLEKSETKGAEISILGGVGFRNTQRYGNASLGSK